MIRRYALRDDQWRRIGGLLPGREDTVGMTAKDNRVFVESGPDRYRQPSPGVMCLNVVVVRRTRFVAIADGQSGRVGDDIQGTSRGRRPRRGDDRTVEPFCQ